MCAKRLLTAAGKNRALVTGSRLAFCAARSGRSAPATSSEPASESQEPPHLRPHGGPTSLPANFFRRCDGDFLNSGAYLIVVVEGQAGAQGHLGGEQVSMGDLVDGPQLQSVPGWRWPG